jgi:CubicO group peptidase (beta-lactamase class C family)
MTASESSARISIDAAAARDIDALFVGLDRPDHPGAAVAVIAGGSVIHMRCFGLADIENQIPVTPQTVFRLGSVTKHLSATGILILEARGLLSLNDKLAQHVPEVPACMSSITLRHLLTMTSGLHDGVALPIFCGNAQLALSRKQHLELVSRYDELMYPPGTQMLYSNTNYALLSLVIERISGRPIGEFFEQELFAPLGMTSARLVEHGVAVVPHKARGYLPSSVGNGLESGVMIYETTGDGGADMTMGDFVRWFMNYRTDGLVGRDYRRRMETPARAPDGASLSYGLGLYLTRYRDQTKVSHAGGMPGYLADFSFFPDVDCGVLILSNWMDAALLDMSDRILDRLLGRDAPPAPASAPPGLYLCPERGLAMEIKDAERGSLCFLLGEGSLLAGCAELGYQPVRRGMSYSIGPMQRADEMTVSFGSTANAAFRRCAQPAGSQRLDEFVGIYRSRLLGETHYVRIDAAGDLEITLDSALRALAWKTCVWRAPDVFTANVAGAASPTSLVVVFTRDASGRVNGLRYTIYRCRGLAFERAAP